MIRSLGIRAGIAVAALTPVPFAAKANTVTNSATFSPVLKVDAAASSTSLAIAGLAGPIDNVIASINFTKCDDPIANDGTCEGLNFYFPEEIRMSLVSPLGTNLPLIFALGDASGPTYTNNDQPGGTFTVTFDDTAASVVGGPLPVSGTFRPAGGLLSIFDGEDGNGSWALNFADGSGGDPLSINSWSLTVSSAAGVSVPGPLPVLGAVGAFGWSRRLRSRLRRAAG